MHHGLGAIIQREWAVHYEEGEPIPVEIVDRIVAAQICPAAYLNVRRLPFVITGMAWHTITAPFEGDIVGFEATSAPQSGGARQ